MCVCVYIRPCANILITHCIMDQVVFPIPLLKTLTNGVITIRVPENYFPIVTDKYVPKTTKQFCELRTDITTLCYKWYLDMYLFQDIGLSMLPWTPFVSNLYTQQYPANVFHALELC